MSRQVVLSREAFLAALRIIDGHGIQLTKPTSRNNILHLQVKSEKISWYLHKVATGEWYVVESVVGAEQQVNTDLYSSVTFCEQHFRVCYVCPNREVAISVARARREEYRTQVSP